MQKSNSVWLSLSICCVSELVKLGASNDGKLCRGVTALQRQREREEQRRLKHEKAQQKKNKKKKNTANSTCHAMPSADLLYIPSVYLLSISLSNCPHMRRMISCVCDCVCVCVSIFLSVW